MAIDTIIKKQQTLIIDFIMVAKDVRNIQTYKELCEGSSISPHTFSNFVNNRVVPNLKNFSGFLELVNCTLTLAILNDDQTELIKEVLDLQNILGIVLRKAYSRYLSESCLEPSIRKSEHKYRKNDKLGLSIETGVSNMELWRIFDQDSYPIPRLDTFLRLCYILKVQITLDPPESMTPTLTHLVLNPIKAAIPAVGRVAQSDEEKDTE